MLKVFDRLSASVAVGRRFWPHLAPQKRTLIFVSAAFLVDALLEVARPWPIKWIFDGALAPHHAVHHSASYFVWTGAIAVLLIAIAQSGLDYFGTVRTAQAGQAVTRSMRLAIFSHLCELSPTFHSRHKSGDLIVRLMGDVPMVQTMLVESSITLATRVIVAVGTVVVMAIVDPVLAILVLAGVPVILYLVRSVSREIHSVVRAQRDREGALADFLQETLGAQTVIQSLGSSSYTIHRFKASSRRTTRAGVRAAKLAARLSGLVESTLGLSLAVTLLVGSLRVQGGHLSPGELLVFLSYVRSISKPVTSASKQMAKVAKGTACAERIQRVLDEPQELRRTAGSRKAPATVELLSFQHMSYSYLPGKPALAGIDLEIRRGELTALFGPSGAGKSTLTALALRLMDPTEGVVRLDGFGLREYDLDSLRSTFALSMQESLLFGESVRENLLLGKPEATEAELLHALRAADAQDFVAALPQGLDSELGSAGSGLSGGQRRRLCLARALLRQAPILVLDEPFNGLDRQSAERVLRTLRDYARDHIVLVITHEVERLDGFDRVIFLENGRVRATGRHEELFARVPLYQEVCHAAREEAS
jgi:ABC-type multidrug transport system fused ATPase/permease subunit